MVRIRRRALLEWKPHINSIMNERGFKLEDWKNKNLSMLNKQTYRGRFEEDRFINLKLSKKQSNTIVNWRNTDE